MLDKSDSTLYTPSERRANDEFREFQLNQMRNKRLQKWRERYYYDCVNCHESASPNPHIIRLVNVAKFYPPFDEKCREKAIELYVLCDTCYAASYLVETSVMSEDEK